MSSGRESKLGTFSTLSIGIGGMVGGGTFAVTGLGRPRRRSRSPTIFIMAHDDTGAR